MSFFLWTPYHLISPRQIFSRIRIQKIGILWLKPCFSFNFIWNDKKRRNCTQNKILIIKSDFFWCDCQGIYALEWTKWYGVYTPKIFPKNHLFSQKLVSKWFLMKNFTMSWNLKFTVGMKAFYPGYKAFVMKS